MPVWPLLKRGVAPYLEPAFVPLKGDHNPPFEACRNPRDSQAECVGVSSGWNLVSRAEQRPAKPVSDVRVAAAVAELRPARETCRPRPVSRRAKRPRPAA